MTKKNNRPKTTIPKDQMDLPVTFDALGKPMTLRQVMKSPQGTGLSFNSLSPEKRAELTVSRIEAQPEFEVSMIGGGLVTKDQAVEEVRAQSEIGKTLIEIEERVILNLVAEVQNR